MAVTKRKDLVGEFNVGTGVETSINELQEMMARIAGSTAAASHGPAKTGEQRRSVLDAGKLRRLASVRQPEPFREGLQTTVMAFRKR